MPVFAEGRCPPGQYPIGGQGVAGCAPIPSVPARPSGAWRSTWGAVATSPTQLAMGVSKDQRRKRRAASEALEQCERSGARDCVVQATYRNECVAVAAPGKPGPGDLVVSTGATPQMVISTSMAMCFSLNRGDCEVGYMHCNAPQWVLY